MPQRLLVDEIRIVDLRQSLVVVLPHHPENLATGGIEAARNDQRGIAQVDDAHLTSIGEPPAAAQLSRDRGLSSVRDLGSARGRHSCIVSPAAYKAMGCDASAADKPEYLAVDLRGWGEGSAGDDGTQGGGIVLLPPAGRGCRW